MRIEDIIESLINSRCVHEYTEDHDNNILIGKVNLMLYTTLGEPSFFEWLSSAQPKGNHYEFKEYLIYRRPQANKDVCSIDEYGEFKKAVKHFAGKDIENPDLLMILELLLSKSHKHDLDKARGFLDASILLTAKLARFLRRPKALPGDIVHADDLTKDFGITLLDLYCEQECLHDRLEAAQILAGKFDISKDPFEVIQFDHRTRWAEVSQSVTWEDDNTSENVISFTDDGTVRGRVFLKDGKIDDVETYWSKSVDQRPARTIPVPCQDEFLLYNLNRLRRTGNDCSVIVCDSLTAAHKISIDFNKKHQKVQNEIDELNHPDRYRENLRWLYDDLWKRISPALKIEFPWFEPDNSNVDILDYNTLSIDNTHSFGLEFSLAFFCLTTLNKNDYQAESSHDNVNFGKYIRVKQQVAIVDFDKPYEIRRQKFDPNYKISSEIHVSFWEAFKVFTRCLSLIEAGIQKQKEEDAEKLEGLQRDLKELDSIVVTSWYGKDKTIERVDLRPLRKKMFIYYLFDPDNKESVSSAFKFQERLNQQLPKTEIPHIRFVTQLDKPFLNPEELKKLAEEQGIEETVSKDSRQFADSVTFDDESLKCEEEKFIFEPLFRRRSISMIYSEPNVGKTFFAQSLALAMVHGAKLCDMRSPTWKAAGNKPLRVLYIDSEMSKGSFFKRLRMLKDFYAQQYKGDAVPQLEYKLVAKSDWNLAGESSEHRDRVSKMLHLGTKEQIDFVIFDNLSTLTGGSDSQKNWMTFFAWLRQLSNEGVASCCLHHSGKNGDQRGTSLRSATLDNVIRLRRALEGDNSISLIVTVEKVRDVAKVLPMHIKLVKSKQKTSDGEGNDENTGRKKHNNDEAPRRWVTMLANGKESLDIQERNHKAMLQYETKLLSNKSIADFLGMEESTLKALIAKNKKGQKDTQ
ncbi:MAG: AAA family ATPase [Lentisphaeria bacterium]|nr:AAA family ATPase [Lentisphaeria bacterium]